MSHYSNDANLDTSKIRKTVAIIGLTIFSVNLVLIPNRISGYRPSLYTHVPSMVYALGTIAIFISIVSYLLSSMIEEIDVGITAFLPMYLQLLILISMPWVLGYAIRSGDAMTHFGTLNSITVTGQLPPDPGQIIYPSIHIMFSAVSVVSGMKPLSTFWISSPVIAVIYLLFIFSLSRKGQVDVQDCFLLLPFVIGARMLSRHPSAFAYTTLFLGILLLLYCHQKTFRVIALVAILSIGIWLQHSFVPIYLIGVVVITRLLKRPVSAMQFRDDIGNLALLMALTGSIWFMYAREGLFNKAVGLISYVFTGVYSAAGSAETADPGGNVLVTIFDVLGYTALDFLLLVLRRFGSLFLIVSMAGFGLVIAYHQDELGPIRDVTTVVYFSSIGLSIILFFVEIPVLTFTRILRPSLFLGVVPAALFMGNLKNRFSEAGGALRSIQAFLLIALLVTSLVGFSYAHHYNRPNEIDANSYVTYSNLHKYGWMYEYVGITDRVVSLNYQPRRFADFLLPRSQTAVGRLPLAPPHFGYPEGLQAVMKSGYYIETKRGRLLHLKIGDTTELNKGDYSKLNNDVAVSNIYHNGKNVIYRFNYDEHNS